ncbi:MAG: hypothetical protein R3F05_07965 [Planctomycetota bacterium]|nr:hypothetical protein [Planctomycetota bacterium]MCB9825171.1 hypothetical protein [Planctomycetota bacterium]MCB9901994.1 hypothetical protein [Planctomycetota bacterium]
MRKTFWAPLALAALLVHLPTPAWSHGGQFKHPPGAVDPGQRLPTDPPPPPPPPPTQPPTTGGDDSDGKPPKAGPTTPPPGGATPPTTGGSGLGGSTRGRGATMSFDDWVFWYAYNRATIENLKEAIYSRTSSGPLAAVVGESGGNRDDATHDVRSKIRSVLVPAMLWALDPANARDPDVESAAAIGLAKMTTDPVHIALIEAGLTSKEKLMRESAALALGLLRRAKPEDQFTAGDLDRVRDTLFGVLGDDDHDVRTRCFAAFGLGLLGDQPSGRDGAPRGAEITTRLFSHLDRDTSSDEIPVAVLTAIGLQDPGTLTEDQRTLLRDLVTRGRLGGRSASEVVISEAASTLGHVGNDRDVKVLLRVLTSRRTGAPTAGSCAIALGRLAALLDAEGRVDVAKDLIGALDKLRSGSTTGFALISLARIAVADLASGSTAVLGSTKLHKVLADVAVDGRALERPYGALALGLVAEEIGETPRTEAEGDFRHDALRVLREGASSKRLSAHDQAAYALALGIARDSASTPLFLEILKDSRGDAEKQGYAAIALGLVAEGGSVEGRKMVRELLDGTRDEDLKVQCATALGLLRDHRALDDLIPALQKAETQSLKGQLALAIARIGDGRAIAPLVDIMKDRNEKDLTRAIVTAALGVIGDLEWIPSLHRITQDINYRSMNDSRREIVSIL